MAAKSAILAKLAVAPQRASKTIKDFIEFLVFAGAVLEHDNQLILRAAEGIVAGVGLAPHTQPLQLQAMSGGGFEEVVQMVPIHAQIEDRMIGQVEQAG